MKKLSSTISIKLYKAIMSASYEIISLLWKFNPLVMVISLLSKSFNKFNLAWKVTLDMILFML